MGTRLLGFKGEYLWEFGIGDRKLSALAEAFPAERYGWRSAETARSVSEILMHVAAGNLTLLGIVGVDAAPDLYGKLEGEVVPRMLGMINKNDSLEKTIRTNRRSSPYCDGHWMRCEQHLHKQQIPNWSGRMFSLESALPFAEFICED